MFDAAAGTTPSPGRHKCRSTDDGAPEELFIPLRNAARGEETPVGHVGDCRFLASVGPDNGRGCMQAWGGQC